MEGLGIDQAVCEDILLRHLLNKHTATITELAKLIGAVPPVAGEISTGLRERHLVQVVGANGLDYRLELTESGHKIAAQSLTEGRHSAILPVSIEEYRRVVLAQKASLVVTVEKLMKAFEGLVVEPGFLDHLGPALIDDGAMFLYGPAGTGKTEIVKRLGSLTSDLVHIPRYLEVGGQLISVFNPATHIKASAQPDRLDQRWVLCQRPLVIIGGELDRQMLDLHFDPISGLSAAPIQVRAANGILVLDDFGRHSVRPEQILNRWIAPLGNGIDHLRIPNGQMVEVPFELKLVISTNLDPKSLGDEAFLRRLRNKVHVGRISDDTFKQILINAANSTEITVTQSGLDSLTEQTRAHHGDLRSYVAVEFCRLAKTMCAYDGVDCRLDAALVGRVARLFFVSEQAETMVDRTVQAL